MLRVLFKDAGQSPGKLLALCLVLYLATVSFFVSVFLVLLGARWIQKSMQRKARAIETAEAEAEAARIEAEKLAAAERAARSAKVSAVVATVSPVTSTESVAANDPDATTTSDVPRYARSAVVTPIRTGIR